MAAKETILSEIVFSGIDNISKEVAKIIKKEITFAQRSFYGLT
ncbi:hypothetical protein [Bacteroides fluxus]|uniref:Uncharacterized protein n=1 Tax=Bacteroides fluxus YIT 12057 TaxID=763034 RepID=F3PYP6_9BACE|nr:hypothetical protein [Bacteroides fluxus]EGF49316.1 hypothetical protein HMPREF9446_03952 [Bacteroides fluxus YIT 12057]